MKAQKEPKTFVPVQWGSQLVHIFLKEGKLSSGSPPFNVGFVKLCDFNARVVEPPGGTPTSKQASRARKRGCFCTSFSPCWLTSWFSLRYFIITFFCTNVEHVMAFIQIRGPQRLSKLRHFLGMRVGLDSVRAPGEDCRFRKRPCRCLINLKQDPSKWSFPKMRGTPI